MLSVICCIAAPPVTFAVALSTSFSCPPSVTATATPPPTTSKPSSMSLLLRSASFPSSPSFLSATCPTDSNALAC
ncbi:unnamed protein product [Closterium sp. NIES-54]